MSLDDLQARLRGTLDQHFSALAQEHEAALAEARRQAAADAERESAGKLQAARTEWESQVQAMTAAIRAEGEQQAAAMLARHRAEHEQALAREVTQAVADARRAAEIELESERERARHAIEAAREDARAEAEAEWQRAQTEIDTLRLPKAAMAADGAPPASLDGAVAGMRAIDDAVTLSQALDALLAHAGTAAGRAALFLIDGERLKAWKASGIPDADVQAVDTRVDADDVLAQAVRSGRATSSGPTPSAPGFARLAAGREGLAVPLMIGGHAAAVLYADSGSSAEVVEALVRHASAVVALRTATRTLEVLGGAADAGEQGARRYARLLISEIKLYNEGAVRAGREQRDLLQRLRSEIDRAQRLYEERVPSAIGGRQVFFQQELVQTLAGGDPALLGSA